MAVRARPITDREVLLNKWRPQNIGASEGGALLGIDTHCSPLQLYYRKLGILEPDEDDNTKRRGRWLEPGVLKATAEMRPDLQIWNPEMYFDDPALRIGCTPDAFATDKKGRLGVIQAKTVGENVFQEWAEKWGYTEDGNVHPPLAYELQTMIEAMLTKRLDFALLSVMIVGWRVDLRIFPVPILTKTWEVFQKRVKQFWTNFEKGIAPPVSGIDGELIKKLYPGKADMTVDLTGNNRLPEMLERHDALAEKLKEGRKPLKPLEKEYEGVRVEIKGLMGDAEYALLPDGRIATLLEQTNPGWKTRVLHIKKVKEAKRNETNGR